MPKSLRLTVSLLPDGRDKCSLLVRTFTKELVRAYSEGEEAANWFSEAIGEKVLLARSHEKTPVEIDNDELNLDLCRSTADLKQAWHLETQLHFVSQESTEALKIEAAKRNPEVVCVAY